MDFFELPEQSLQMLERLTGLKVTIIDNNGIFNKKQRRMVFSPERASHKKNAVCLCGFSEKCIDHCRYAMNRECISTEEPFFSTCWKGISQIVVPLKFNSIHYGMLYAGTFRSREKEAPEKLPPEFYPLFEALPVEDREETEKLLPLLRIYADGILFYLRKANIVNDEYDLRSAKISDFIHQNLNRPIGLPDLAEELERSPSHTSTLVRKLCGQSFSELLQRRRVERAEHYLSATELKLHEIAKLCGFSSEFHLSRVFRQHKGIAPGVYRKRADIKKPGC